MATPSLRRSENMPGSFFVDSSCIDCDTCRWVAPEVFRQKAGQSAVHHQPQNPAEELKAFQALLACPTASIGSEKNVDLIKKAQESFPINIEGNVYYCGYHSEASFGAASYFIQRPEGNILIDSPRYNAPLVKRLEQLGGVKYLFLTHRDDVADHDKFHEHFGCERILHKADQSSRTKDVEILIDTEADYDLAPDIKLIPVPGHTEGSVVLLYQNKFLLTGDHLDWDDEKKRLNAFRYVNWYSWEIQTESMQKLLNYDFEWVLPGHGRRINLEKSNMKLELQKLVAWMKSA